MKIAFPLLLASGVIFPLVASAQSQRMSQNAIPIFFEDELEDIGPQFLLKSAPEGFQYFRGILDGQLQFTTNPTLADSQNRKGTDLLIGSARFSARTRPTAFQSGELSGEASITYQMFRYGTFSGTDTLIGGLRADNNDFEALSLSADARWERNPWQARLGIRWTELYNDSSSGGFYREFAPNWTLSRFFSLNNNTGVRLAYNGAWFFSKSEAFNLTRDDFNDRTTHALSASLLHQVNPKLLLNPEVRATYANYTNNPTGSRHDLTVGASFLVSYQLNEYGFLRIQTGIQKRQSSGEGVADYLNFDLGIGATLAFNF